MIVTDQELKQYFQTGDFPTQQQFYNLIDSKVNVGTPAASIGGVVTGGTTGSILFIGGASTLQENNPNLYWDNSNKKLGLGTQTPQSRLHLYGDTNSDITPLQVSYERPAGVFNSNTNWISHSALQGGKVVGGWGLAQQVIGQGTRHTWSVTDDTSVNATEGMRLSQTKQLSIGNFINDGAVIDIASKGPLGSDYSLRIKDNSNTKNHLIVNGDGSMILGNATSPVTYAILQIESKTKGVLFPKLDDTAVAAIPLSSAVAGMVVYNTTHAKMQFCDGSSWHFL